MMARATPTHPGASITQQRCRRPGGTITISGSAEVAATGSGNKAGIGSGAQRGRKHPAGTGAMLNIASTVCVRALLTVAR